MRTRNAIGYVVFGLILAVILNASSIYHYATAGDARCHNAWAER